MIDTILADVERVQPRLQRLAAHAGTARLHWSTIITVPLRLPYLTHPCQHLPRYDDWMQWSFERRNKVFGHVTLPTGSCQDRGMTAEAGAPTLLVQPRTTSQALPHTRDPTQRFACDRQRRQRLADVVASGEEVSDAAAKRPDQPITVRIYALLVVSVGLQHITGEPIVYLVQHLALPCTLSLECSILIFPVSAPLV